MSYEFKKLADVEALPEVPEVATVFAEVNGEVKRIPSSGLGGVVKTAIIKDSRYDDAISMMANGGGGGPVSAPMVADADPRPAFDFSCLNMTFEEAYETMANGEPLDAKAMVVFNSPMVIPAQAITFVGIAAFGVPAIVFYALIDGMSFNLFWTADGISTEPPAGGGPS